MPRSVEDAARSYLATARAHRAEYAKMREEAWDLVPEVKGETPAARAASFEAKARELAAAKLEVDAKRDGKTGGTSLKTAVKVHEPDGDVNNGNFKYGRDAFVRAEAAARLLVKVDEPNLPLAAVKLPAEDPEEVYLGWLKANIRGDDAPNDDPSSWSRAQVREVLVGAVFCELLGNYDAKTDQWKAKDGHALNGDLDHALGGYARPSDGDLDRHHQGRRQLKLGLPAMPPAQNLVYLQYVRGKLKLDDADFGAMFDAIARVQGLSEAEFKACFEDAAEALCAGDKKHGPFEHAEELLGALEARRDGLHLQFAELVDELKAEKKSREDGTLGLFRRAKLWVKDKKLELLADYVDGPWMERVNRLSQKLTRAFQAPKPVADTD